MSCPRFTPPGFGPCTRNPDHDGPCAHHLVDGINTFDRERGWMQTFTGRRFYPLAPRAEDVDIEDLAHGLAMTCRYNGHAKRFYSVAEHCVLVSTFVDPRFARQALLHDSAEAYIGDMIRPLKHQPEMVEFRNVEAAIEIAVFAHFGINSTPESHAAVKVVDNRLLVDEINELMCIPSMYDDVHVLQPLGASIEGWTPRLAESIFLDRYHELFG